MAGNWLWEVFWLVFFWMMEFPPQNIAYRDYFEDTQVFFVFFSFTLPRKFLGKKKSKWLAKRMHVFNSDHDVPSDFSEHLMIQFLSYENVCIKFSYRSVNTDRYCRNKSSEGICRFVQGNLKLAFFL